MNKIKGRLSMTELSLGEKIKSLRKKNNLTQKQLADTISISFSTFRRWETNEHKPNIQIITRLAEILHTSVAYLAGELDDPTPIVGNSFSRFLKPNEPIKETVVMKHTPSEEKKTVNFKYWGNVLDETQNAISRGNSYELSLIETVLNSACEMITESKKKNLQASTIHDSKEGIRQHFDIHDNNNTMGTQNITVATVPEEKKP